MVVLQSMFYKQNSNKRQIPYQIDNTTRLEDQRKLMQLWKDEHVIEDYQMILLKFFDQFANKTQLHQQIQIELKRTYQHESFYFKIERLLEQREKTVEQLKNQTIFLQRFKNEHYRKQPNLQPICILIDHIRKIHLLVSQQVYEMFNSYGHPKKTKTGYRYLHIFSQFNDELQFLNESLMKYYLPFSNGFDPLFLQTVQKLRRCYNNQILVYDQNVEELINLNASYLYRLLRSHQRMLQFISVANQEEKEEFYKYSQPNQMPQEEDQKPTFQSSERYSPNRKQPPYLNTPITNNKYIDEYKSNLEELQRKQRELQKRLKDIQVQKQLREAELSAKTRQLQLENQLKRIQIQRLQQQKKSSIYSRPTNTATRTLPHAQTDKDNIGQHMPKSLKSNKHSSLNGSNQKSRSKTPQQQNDRLRNLHLHPVQSKVQPIRQHKRYRTQQHTITKNHQNISQSRHKYLPKLKQSKIQPTQNHADCLCRQKYKKRHVHDQTNLNEQQVQKRRKQIIRDIQAKYKIQAQRQMRLQLSKLGDVTYHKIRNMQHSRISTMKAKRKIFL